MDIRGYACHWHRANANRERVTMNSFDEAIRRNKENNIYTPINYNHNSDVILGHITNFYKDSEGLFITATLNDDIDVVKNYVKPLIIDGTLNRFSTEGYILNKDITKLDDGTYVAKNFDLRAVAIVPLPADIGAVFTYNSIKDESLHIFNAFDTPNEDVVKKVVKNRYLYIL